MQAILTAAANNKMKKFVFKYWTTIKPKQTKDQLSSRFDNNNCLNAKKEDSDVEMN